MTWDAFKDFKYDPDSMGGFKDFKYDPRSYTTDWNKDFGKYTDEAKKEDKGLKFLKTFTKGLFGGEDGSQRPYSFGAGSGANLGLIAPDVAVLQSGGGASQYIPGQAGWGEKLLGAGIQAGLSLL